MFPAEGITKGELASYYETIAPVMLPHLRGRAVFVGRIVFEPAAARLLAAFGEVIPVMVHLFLRVAVHHKRDRFSELESWTTV